MTARYRPISQLVSVERSQEQLLQKSKTSITENKARQTSNIMNLGKALAAAGVHGLDQQAQALGLCRSTAWTLLKAQHKGSGLSANVINKMLAARELPPVVRKTILEYVAEKIAGRYGDSKSQLNRFTSRLCPKYVQDARELLASNYNHETCRTSASPRVGGSHESGRAMR
jgi:hypothetical protein